MPNTTALGYKKLRDSHSLVAGPLYNRIAIRTTQE